MTCVKQVNLDSLFSLPGSSLIQGGEREASNWTTWSGNYIKELTYFPFLTLKGYKLLLCLNSAAMLLQARWSQPDLSVKRYKTSFIDKRKRKVLNLTDLQQRKLSQVG